MKETKQKNSSIAITFYVVAVLLLLVFAFMSWIIFDSIKQTMDSYGMTFGELWEQMWQSVVNMFVTQSLPFLIYAFLSYGIGYVINQISISQDSNEVTEKEVVAMEDTTITASVSETESVQVEAEPQEQTKKRKSTSKKKQADKEDKAEEEKQAEDQAETKAVNNEDDVTQVSDEANKA